MNGGPAAVERLGPKELLLAYPNLLRSLSVLVFLCFWEYVGRRMDPLFMTFPTAILAAGWAMLRSGDLMKALGESLLPFFIGMSISVVFGIALGLLMGLSRIVEYLFDPYLNALNAIPRVALVPLVTLWLGLGVGAKIVIIVSVAIFPIIINTYAGVRDVRNVMLDVGKAYSATGLQILFKIIFPAALPFVMAGIRVGLGLGLLGMVVAEFFTSLGGVGGIIVNEGNLFHTAPMFVAIVVVGVLGVALTQASLALEQHWTRWRQTERSAQ